MIQAIEYMKTSNLINVKYHSEKLSFSVQFKLRDIFILNNNYRNTIREFT